MPEAPAGKFWLSALLAGMCVACAGTPRASTDPLPSWNVGVARNAIVAFVERVTKPGSPQFVAPAERIAVFDNDGTLWAEQPAYFQLLFAIDRVRRLASEHPNWKTDQPFASLLNGDIKGALGGGERAAVEILAASHAGISTDAFQQVVKDWLATASHPITHRPYTQMVYQPMLEVLTYLRVNGFKTFIVSGGGVEFLRAIGRRDLRHSARARRG